MSTLFLSSRCVPHTQGYHLHLRTLFAISVNRKVASQLQSHASVLAKRASLGQHHCSRPGKQPWDRQGGDAASTANRLSITVATPQMFSPDPSTRASLASSVVGTGTAVAGAEMSLIFAGGCRHGGVGGGNGGTTPIKESGIYRECGYHKGAWCQTYPEPFFGQQRCIVLADSRPGTENVFVKAQRKMAFPPCKPFVPWVVTRV